MAIITSAKTGLFSDLTVWVGGIVPVLGDSVIINRTGTALETFSTDATGYAIGATIITLTGTVLAGSYVVGEAVRFGNDPNYYTITAWVFTTKILTVTPLIVAIPASATLVQSCGHVVTVDGTYHVGDDTTTAFSVLGTLRASRTVNNSLTVRGQLFQAATLASRIDYGSRFRSDAIPSSITAQLILNSSAAMVNFKYGLFVGDTANFSSCGATKQINARITTTIAAGGTTCVVDDATGWVVGDKIIMAASNGTTTAYDDLTISTITPGAGTTATITFPATTFSHGTNCPIGNRNSNVTIKNFNTTTTSFICFRQTSTANNNRREVDNTVFEYVGSNNAQTNTQIFMSSSSAVLITPFTTFNRNFFFNCASNNNLFINVWNSGGYELTNLGFLETTTNGASFYTASASFVGLRSSVFYFTNGASIVSAFSQGGQGCTYTDIVFCSVGGNFPISHTNGDGSLFTRCAFHTSPTFTGTTRLEAGSGNFVNCNFSKLVGTTPSPSLWGTPTFQALNDTSTNAVKGEWVFTDCNFGTPVGTFNNFQNPVNPQYALTVVNKDTLLTEQELYTVRGTQVRDNSTFTNSTSAIRINPRIANTASTRSFKILAPNSVARRVIGYLRYDATYGVATPPSATLSGLGITPQTYTAGGSANTWYKFDLSATQVSGADGNLTLTCTGQSTSTTGNYWISGIIDLPFVTNSRHYGFLFDSNPYRAVDSVIQQTNEATVGAYTGISIVGSTITLSVNHTIRELYDYCKWYLCQTANLSVAEFFTSTDRVNFTSSYNLTLNGGSITGTGNLSLGTMTLTRTSETSTVPITYSSGAAVFGNIPVSGLVANSRVRLNNTTDNIELYNAVVAATSVTIPATWTANKTLDLRVTLVTGATAYLPYQSSGTLTNTLTSFTASQLVDTVYNANAIDGSTIIEFSTDYPNIQVDLSGVATSTTPQRLYAWYQYATHTSQGIVYYFNGINAQDAYNYVIKSSVVNLQLDNTSGHNTTITGGYISRDDGASYIYSLTTKSIIPIYDRAYIANSDFIQSMVALMPDSL